MSKFSSTFLKTYNHNNDDSQQQQYDNEILESKLNSLPVPPLNLTFEIKNSTVSVPVSMVTENLNISDVYMYSPHVEFPLTFNSENMSYDIDIKSNNLPMTLNLNPDNGSTIPISLMIQGSNSIPVTLQIQSLDAPFINWILFSLLAFFNFLALGLVIVQHFTISRLRRRLDAIDICNQVHRDYNNSPYHSPSFCFQCGNQLSSNLNPQNQQQPPQPQQGSLQNPQQEQN
eukprot:gene9622-11792_t